MQALLLQLGFDQRSEMSGIPDNVFTGRRALFLPSFFKLLLLQSNPVLSTCYIETFTSPPVISVFTQLS
jgi:hypothetical protein